MFKRWVLVTALVIPVVHAQSRMDLLRRAGDLFNHVDSFDVKGRVTARIPGSSWQITYDAETEAAQPKLIPISIRQPWMQYVSNVGNAHTAHVVADAKDPFPLSGFALPPFGRYQNLAQWLVDAQQTGVETIRFDGKDHQCDVIDAVYDESPEFKPNSKLTHRTIYIDPESLWVLKVSTPDPKVGRWTFVATSITFNQPPSEALIKVLQQFSSAPKFRSDWTGKSAPDVTLPDLQGHRVRLADLRGHAVLLDFWASFCAPCRRAAAFSEQLGKTYHDAGLIVWGITQDTPEDAKKWLNFNHLSLPALLDSDGAAFKAFQVDGIPVAILIDERGQVVKYWTGVDDPKDIETTVAAVVRQH